MAMAPGDTCHTTTYRLIVGPRKRALQVLLSPPLTLHGKVPVLARGSHRGWGCRSACTAWESTDVSLQLELRARSWPYTPMCTGHKLYRGVEEHLLLYNHTTVIILVK